VDLNSAELGPAGDSAIRPPDDFYYASLYLAPATRHAVRVVEAARRAITDVPGNCSDRGVAHLKLAWWQTELQQLAAGAPRHPVTHALLPLVQARPALLASFEALLDATISGLNQAALPDHAALMAWLKSQQRGVLDYYLDSGTAPAAAHRETLVELACLLERSYALRGLRQHRRATPLLLPEQALRAAGLSVDGVRAAQTSTELQGVLAGEIDWLRAQLSARSAALPRKVRRAQRLLLTLAACASEALALTRDDDCRVLERRVELLPVRKLWLAWRVRHWG
jgi:phytoene synthase